MNVGFGGEGSGGEYHSVYDSYDHYVRFKDPNFAYGIALTQVMGRAVMRLADAEVLPFSFPSFANTVTKYVGEVRKLAETMRTETMQQNKLIQDNRYVLVADPTQPLLPPKVHDSVPHLNFAPLENALTTLDKSVRAFDTVSNRLSSLSGAQLEALNRTIYQTERYLLSDKGLPRRAWFKHQIYAPGFYTGYGVKTLPGVREAIEERKWGEVDEQIQRVANALNGFSAQIDKAAAMAPAVSAK